MCVPRVLTLTQDDRRDNRGATCTALLLPAQKGQNTCTHTLLVHVHDPVTLTRVRSEVYTQSTVQAADAQTILNAASARMLRVSYGVM
jgi:hypothetical protein